MNRSKKEMSETPFPPARLVSGSSERAGEAGRSTMGSTIAVLLFERNYYFFSMNSSRVYYRRNLPHYQPDGYAFFISFRLYGTLPAEVINEFKMIKNKKLALISGYNNLKVRKEKYEEFKDEYFKSFDKYLDKRLTGNHWLRQKEVAEIVKEAIHYRDGPGI